MHHLTTIPVLFLFMATGLHADDPLQPLVDSIRGAEPFVVQETVTVSASQDGLSETSNPVAIHVERGSDGHGRVELNGYTVFIDPANLSVVHETNQDAYVTVPHSGRPVAAMRGLFTELPSIWLTLAFAHPNENGWLDRMLPAAPGLRAVAVEADGALDHYELVSDGVTGRFDPTLPGAMVVEVEGGDWVPEGATLGWQSRIRPDDARGTAFDPAGRRSLDHIAALVQAPETARAGDPANALVLPLASGGQFDLAEHRDEVVVLDFWASWCGPCRSALPRLDRLTARLKEEGLPLTVLTVNTSERERDPGARTEFVLRERDAIGFTLPVGIDLDGAAARNWGVSALPTTVIITPAGLVASVHQGAGADYERMLEEEIRALLPATPRP